MIDATGEYIAELVSKLRAVPGADHAVTNDPEALAGEVFTILTAREFCYLSRTRTAPYRDGTVAILAASIRRGEPLRFYYDIGPGYHASIRPEASGLVFGVGFSELCVLAQTASFCNRVAGLYPSGATFQLVIDNVCGLVTNDIPLERTTAYCAELRQLIAQTGVGDRVSVLVESETFDATGYKIDRARLASDIAAFTPSPDDLENVRRFLGRSCDDAEAAERIAKYRQAGEMTESRLAGVVRGVRMTQRATGGTLGFRPFPGGDSRTQVGEVAISPNAKGVLRPVLLTSRNVGRYRCTQLRYPRLLPAAIPYVTYAEPIEPAPAPGEK
ncbi:MAG TPA: hypothetical protein VFT13_07385 [Candidatus Krumholzibacteria bacterium]|nr:hypothetical protein [Candidatus Krumholzibacteria bacterium]